MENVGITNLKTLVVFLAVMASAADKATKDGLDYNDAGILIPPLMGAPAALAGINEVPKEAADLTQEEMKELQEAVAQALDLEDDQLEAVVEKSLSAAINIYGIVQDVKALRA